jgi:hypothetical protein
MFVVMPDYITAKHLVGEYIGKALVSGAIERWLLEKHDNPEFRKWIKKMEGLILKIAKGLCSEQPTPHRIINFRATSTRESISKALLKVSQKGNDDHHIEFQGEVTCPCPKDIHLGNFSVSIRKSETPGMVDWHICFDEPVRIQKEEEEPS